MQIMCVQGQEQTNDLMSRTSGIGKDRNALRWFIQRIGKYQIDRLALDSNLVWSVISR